MPYFLIWTALADENDRAFMEAVYEEHHALMYAQALLVLRARERAEDAVSDSLIALMKKISLLRTLPRNKLRAYIVTTVRNTALTAATREGKRASAVRDVPLEDIQDRQTLAPESAAVSRDQVSRVRDAIRALPERESAVVMMKFFEGLSDDEIAARLGVRAVTVRSYISRARDKLRDVLQRGEA